MKPKTLQRPTHRPLLTTVLLAFVGFAFAVSVGALFLLLAGCQEPIDKQAEKAAVLNDYRTRYGKNWEYWTEWQRESLKYEMKEIEAR
jgi:hypothetical protein